MTTEYTVHLKLVVMRNREKLKYTEEHFNRDIELQDEMPIHNNGF